MIKQINVEIKSVKDFGRAVLCAQDELDTGESLSVKFTDRWNGFKGMATVRAIDENLVVCQGSLFADGEVTAFVCNEDGPVALVESIAWQPGDACKVYATSNKPTDGEVLDGHYADGLSWSRQDAPSAKPVNGAKLLAAQKLAKRAREAAEEWAPSVGLKMGKTGVLLHNRKARDATAQVTVQAPVAAPTKVNRRSLVSVPATTTWSGTRIVKRARKAA